MNMFKVIALTLVVVITSSIFPADAQSEKNEACKTQECVEYFHKWKVMASAKRVLAMSVLADLYYVGYGTEKDLEESIRYYRKASRFQFAYAQYRAGIFYLSEEAYIDHKEGIKFLKKAARNGHIESAFMLSVIYNTGKLADMDVPVSDKWLAKALVGEHDSAQKYANYLYKSGQVDEEHYVKVNEFISELNLDTPENERNQTVLSNNLTDIEWPEQSEIEVIEVSAPSIAAIFDYELDRLKTTEPATNLATGTRIPGRTCEQMTRCGYMDEFEFQKMGGSIISPLVKRHAGFVEN